MKELKLTKYVQTNATVLDNEFIDQYMVRANGEYVKVYLLLLRHMNQSSGCLSVSELADLLECTEKDVLRALRYWKSEGLLDYLDDTPDDPTLLILSKPLFLRFRHLQQIYSSTVAVRNVQNSKNYSLLPNSISARHFPLLILTRLLIFMTH